MYLYLTADQPAKNHGGGRVTYEESEALRALAAERGEEFLLLSRKELEEAGKTFTQWPNDPWQWDTVAYSIFGNRVKLCHIYAGTFTNCVKKLQGNGAKVVYTVAAHSVEASRKAHEDLGIPYARLYPHLCDPELFRKYIGGYLRADAVVTPSTHSRDVVRAQGVFNRVEVIPHGIDLPESMAPLPKQFVVGYLGAVGADKGLRYLFEAWKKLNYKDARLVVAGKDSNSAYVRQLWAAFGGGNVTFAGWQENLSDFYDNISLYVQPSVSEGFGIEVLEAMAHGRPVICTEGAGACDLVRRDYDPPGVVVPAGDSNFLAGAIDNHRKSWEELDQWGVEGQERYRKSVIESCRDVADDNTWDKIRARYKQLWEELLK